MTFIPAIQTITDSNNSTTTPTSSFIGVWTKINGYESVNINIVCDESSTANGLQIQFSPDGTNISKIVKDTIFANINYSKSFTILDTYYRISFTTTSTPTAQKITSRLLVSSQESVGQNNFYLSNDSIIDAFGKLRVSNPYTLLDMKFPIQPPSQTSSSEYLNNSELICTRLVGSGVYTQTTTGNGLRTISVDNQPAGTFTSQSRKYCNYQPGKSLLVLCSGIIIAGQVAGLSSQTNVTTRIGFFDDYNGFYFQYDTTNMAVVYKSNGVIIETITQSNWNIDTMNGNGSSSLYLDFSKTQLFVIDFEWLGVGRIRYGFYAFGKINYCHQILNINTLTAPYMQSANLPIRYELQGNGAGSTGALIQICSTVISEGGFNPQGRPFTANNGLPAANNVTTAETPLLAIKGGGVNYYHQNIIPLGVELLNTANTTDAIIYRIRLFLSPSPEPGTFTWQNVSNYSVVQYATTITSFTTTDSIILEEGYFTGKSSSSFNSLTDVFSNVIQLTADASNISDIIVVTAQIQSGNAKVACHIQWQEVY
jgi:hypothetical protein